MNRNVILGLTVLLLVGVSGERAHALTMQGCSAKYNAAQGAGTLNGMKWNAFRKAECGSEASAASSTSAEPSTSPRAAQASTDSTARSRGTAPSGSAIFPNAVSTKYSSASAGKARMHTCLDQYNANKASKANAGLKWIEKGGGYYSECNQRLRG